MNRPRSCILAIGIIAGLACFGRADDNRIVVAKDRPDSYRPLDQQTIEQLQNLQTKRRLLTKRDLESISTQIHDVSYPVVPANKADIVPGSTRPQGSLQLDAVIIDPQ